MGRPSPWSAPSHGAFTLLYDATEQNPCRLNFRDANGRLLWAKTIEAAVGNNRYELSAQDFPAGVYVLELLTENGVGAKRVLVQ